MPTSNKYKISVPFLILQEGDYFVAYCPSLELSSYGHTITDAKQSFAEALKIFVKETEKKGTLEKVLLGLGWTLQQKPSFKYQPPELSAKNRRALQRKTVSISKKSVPIRYVAA